MRLLERYSQAVNSSDLTVNERTTWSDTDVLGAAGLAARYNPLGVALTRLFADGDADAVLVQLTELAFKRARTVRVRLDHAESRILAMAVLGWHRFGTCQPCGGTGFQVIPGTPVQGDACPHCRSSGKVAFDSQFPRDLLELAQWMSAEIERAQAAAGTDAMRALAPRLDL